jgi:pimeloyl-ACP methyl ester carboxylesterase
MKKIFLNFIFFLILFSFPFKIYGFQFFKYQSNPLTINFIDNYAYNLQVDIYLKDSLGCHGIATARRSSENYFSLVKIDSFDCKNWQMTKEILNIGQDISNPRLFINDSGERTLFFAKLNDNGFYQIYSTSCDQDLNCSSNINLVLDPNKDDQKEKNGYFAPYVLKDNSNYYLFYGVWGNDGFKIRLAYSDNLQSWQKCGNDLLTGGVDGPFPLIKDQYLYLFYHKSDATGIKLSKAALPLSCNLNFQDLGYQLSRGTDYDANHLIFPSVLVDGENLKLFYSGLANSAWKFNLACTDKDCNFNLITPTPTPTLVPTKTPIIIIPGFMASWNKRAILHNENVSQADWKIASFVKEYNGLIETLKNLGYQENENLFLFAYDWRKPILDIVEDLTDFITNHQPLTTSHFFIVGHSLGGLVGRIFTQKYPDKVEKIISVGSPHRGVIQVYKPLEAGEIDRENTFLWLAEKLVLVLNKSNIEPDRETIKKLFPISLDLFPTFDFLKDENGQLLSTNNLVIKNDLLNLYDQNFSDIFPKFISVYGEKDSQTPVGYKIKQPDLVNQILGNYQDGQPIETIKDLGDYIVPNFSANQDADSEKLVFDHGEIIYEKEAIKKILSLLNISFHETDIVQGEKTKIDTSLIFLIRSPATMTVINNNNIYSEDEGIIFIPEAKSGDYKLEVLGNDLGKYQLIIGQISENNDVWESIDGEITQIQPEPQKDSYLISYDEKTAIPVIPSPTQIPTQTPILTIIPSTPTLTNVPTITIPPTITPTITPIPTSSQNQNQTQSSSTSSNTSNQNNISIPPSTPTVVLFSQNITKENSTNDSEVLGEKTEVKKDNQELKNPIKNQKNNKSIFIILAVVGELSLVAWFGLKARFRGD